MDVKIAAVTDDGLTISQHFGRAPKYLVVAIEGDRVVSRALRDKLGHAQFGGPNEPSQQADPRGHGFDPAAQRRHAGMAAAIADCQVLLTRGMGAGAYESMREAGITPIVTTVADIDAAVAAYVAGTLVDHPEALH